MVVAAWTGMAVEVVRSGRVLSDLKVVLTVCWWILHECERKGGQGSPHSGPQEGTRLSLQEDGGCEHVLTIIKRSIGC